MQRIEAGSHAARQHRRQVLRARSVARPTPTRPAQTTYRVRVRNTGDADRVAWATYAAMARKAARMSQSGLAKRVGVDRVTVYRWETGVQRPTDPDVVAAFAAALGLDVDEALAAAGLRPGTPAPAAPKPPDDPEVRLILTSGVSEARKKELLHRLEELRERDRQRRMDDLRWVLKQG